MVAASAEHSCICALSCLEAAWTWGAVAIHEFMYSPWADSIGLQRSSPPILAGSDSMSRSFSLNAGRPLTAWANLYLMASSKGCRLSLICPVVLNRYLHLFTTPWVKAQKAAWG